MTNNKNDEIEIISKPWVQELSSAMVLIAMNHKVTDEEMVNFISTLLLKGLYLSPLSNEAVIASFKKVEAAFLKFRKEGNPQWDRKK